MSGIMVAKTLSDNGVKDFVILEVTNRIGGKMYKESIAGYTVEKGANWVEGVGGTKMNPIWPLANNSNLSTLLQKSGGEDISILASQRTFGHVPITPLEMAIDFFLYDFEIAEPPRVTSLKNVEPNPTFEEFGEDEYFIADSRGYEYIVHRIAQEFLHSANGSISNPRLKLNKDGTVYTAENAIVSVSVGVLQTKLIELKPDLPLWKLMAIYKWDLVIYCKIFMKFPSKFWPNGPGTEFFMYAHEKRGYYNFWQEHPYTTFRDNRHQLGQCISLESIPVRNTTVMSTMPILQTDTTNQVLDYIKKGHCAPKSHRQNEPCNEDIQRWAMEMERKAWIDKVEVLEDALSHKCKP
ncbi:hypothetical protein SUGI_0338570 [Cryptomeria japonica]|nr:hypothetical protein SUGI_0338570 [Cryptomeria japonica]